MQAPHAACALNHLYVLPAPCASSSPTLCMQQSPTWVLPIAFGAGLGQDAWFMQCGALVWGVCWSVHWVQHRRLVYGPNLN